MRVRASAPGKAVLSGAYAVLEGAPALVAAVSRRAHADTLQPARFTTPELKAAFGDAMVPSFHASELRHDDRKLGLGSSAAILVACLAATHRQEQAQLKEAALREWVFERALRAHQAAQGGGSGIDVAASSFGGFLRLRRAEPLPSVTPVQLPPGVFLQLWAADAPASTPALIAQVMHLKQAQAPLYQSLIGAQAAAAERAAQAVETLDATGFVAALAEQCLALDALGRAAEVEIVLDATRALHQRARAEGAAVLPSGAGGGDLLLYAGDRPPSQALADHALELGLTPLNLVFGAPGVTTHIEA